MTEIHQVVLNGNTQIKTNSMTTLMLKQLIRRMISDRHFGMEVFRNRRGVLITPIPCRYVNNEEGD
jgi:metallophosphoesterase superfamily enzyme